MPNFYAARPIAGGRAAVGLGLNAPFGLATSFSPDWHGRYDAIEASLRTINVSAVGAYQFDSGLSVGGGARYSGGLHRGTDGAVGTPASTESYRVFDAVASYDFSERFALRLNLYNLLDEDYVAAINKSGYRYTPGAPRSAMLTASFRF